MSASFRPRPFDPFRQLPINPPFEVEHVELLAATGQLPRPPVATAQASASIFVPKVFAVTPPRVPSVYVRPDAYIRPKLKTSALFHASFQSSASSSDRPSSSPLQPSKQPPQKKKKSATGPPPSRKSSDDVVEPSGYLLPGRSDAITVMSAVGGRLYDADEEDEEWVARCASFKTTTTTQRRGQQQQPSCDISVELLEEVFGVLEAMMVRLPRDQLLLPCSVHPSTVIASPRVSFKSAQLEDIKTITRWWFCRRMCRRVPPHEVQGKPFIRAYQLSPVQADVYAPFHSRLSAGGEVQTRTPPLPPPPSVPEPKENSTRSFAALLQQRNLLDQAARLAGLVVKREVMKRDLARTRADLFNRLVLDAAMERRRASSWGTQFESYVHNAVTLAGYNGREAVIGSQRVLGQCDGGRGLGMRTSLSAVRDLAGFLRAVDDLSGPMSPTAPVTPIMSGGVQSQAVVIPPWKIQPFLPEDWGGWGALMASSPVPPTAFRNSGCDSSNQSQQTGNKLTHRVFNNEPTSSESLKQQMSSSEFTEIGKSVPSCYRRAMKESIVVHLSRSKRPILFLSPSLKRHRQGDANNALQGEGGNPARSSKTVSEVETSDVPLKRRREQIPEEEPEQEVSTTLHQQAISSPSVAAALLSAVDPKLSAGCGFHHPSLRELLEGGQDEMRQKALFDEAAQEDDDLFRVVWGVPTSTVSQVNLPCNTMDMDADEVPEKYFHQVLSVIDSSVRLNKQRPPGGTTPRSRRPFTETASASSPLSFPDGVVTASAAEGDSAVEDHIVGSAYNRGPLRNKSRWQPEDTRYEDVTLFEPLMKTFWKQQAHPATSSSSASTATEITASSATVTAHVPHSVATVKALSVSSGALSCKPEELMNLDDTG